MVLGNNSRFRTWEISGFVVLFPYYGKIYLIDCCPIVQIKKLSDLVQWKNA